VGLFPSKRQIPLAWRMQPRTLGEFAGQTHIIGPGRVLRRAIEEDSFNSLIIFGPPGTGKTALARIVASRTQSHFISLNAVTSGIQDIRKAVATAESVSLAGQRTILFIDEIHRFNKVQQDALLPDVESGLLTLIGASTENPFFALVPPLASRSLIFQFQRLSVDEMLAVLRRALSDNENGYGRKKIDISPESLALIAELSAGDARKALGSLELAVLTSGEENGAVAVSEDTVREIFQKNTLYYGEDDHYDTISAYIKSMRGSDPDAAIYWLAKMLESGEDPLFIARRLMICAAEDVGNADPQALVLAVAAARTAREIGMPEARIPLAQATAYIAAAPKSNAAIVAIDRALADVRAGRVREVPVHLRDAHYKGAQRIGAGDGYKYPHSYSGHYIDQDYMPERRDYYQPGDEGFERILKHRLQRRRHG